MDTRKSFARSSQRNGTRLGLTATALAGYIAATGLSLMSATGARADNNHGYHLVAIASFDTANGANPSTNLVADDEGNLFGATGSGGAFGDGVVFEIKRGTNRIIDIGDFNGTNGSAPQGSIVIDRHGDIFGTTAFGGANGDGAVYEIIHGTHSITSVASFDFSTSGAFPFSGLVADDEGNLFGTTDLGGSALGADGVLYKVAHGSSTITPIASFGFSFDGVTGETPFGGVAVDHFGNIFGTCDLGGVDFAGTVYEVPRGTTTATSIAQMATVGSNPVSAVTVDDFDNVFGAVQNALYEVHRGSGTATQLAVLPGTASLANPTLVGGFQLIGTTFNGGAAGDGTIYDYNILTRAVTVVAEFNGANGSIPDGRLLITNDGRLLGTANTGGANGVGTVYELKREDAWTLR